MDKHRVFIFGSRNLGALPDKIVNHIEAIIAQTNGNVEFIVGDAIGVDASTQKTLAMLGASANTKVYAMDRARSNIYELPVRLFKSDYNEETQTVSFTNPEGEIIDTLDGVKKLEDIYAYPSYYEIKDKQMCSDCTFAICFWDGESKGTQRNVNRLKAQGKYVYVYTARLK